MLLRLLSDLHLEFGVPFEIEPVREDGDTILVLAGDIHIGSKVEPFLRHAAIRFPHIVYVLGNHEFYYGDIDTLAEEVRESISDLENVSFLDNEVAVVGDVRFIGSTLWTDMDKRNPISMIHIEQALNDYAVIRKDERRLRALDTIELFDEAVKFLGAALAEEHHGPTVVVTHTAPSHLSIHPMFARSLINGAWFSDLDYLLHEHDIAYWFHGHSHQTVHYEIAGTKVRNNPFGYGGYETNLHFDPTFRVAI
jgi:predicted phosphodiesterase